MKPKPPMLPPRPVHCVSLAPHSGKKDLPPAGGVRCDGRRGRMSTSTTSAPAVADTRHPFGGTKGGETELHGGCDVLGRNFEVGARRWRRWMRQRQSTEGECIESADASCGTGAGDGAFAVRGRARGWLPHYGEANARPQTGCLYKTCTLESTPSDFVPLLCAKTEVNTIDFVPLLLYITFGGESALVLVSGEECVQKRRPSYQREERDSAGLGAFDTSHVTGQRCHNNASLASTAENIQDTGSEVLGFRVAENRKTKRNHSSQTGSTMFRPNRNN
ncbi:hypothetical protein C8J57DRAFT_1212688 [Mycena rebaudengoi]|nr:hypothetical protein C8J57DRAFT_1212688 [Mycena rebaudengoi]